MKLSLLKSEAIRMLSRQQGSPSTSLPSLAPRRRSSGSVESLLLNVVSEGKSAMVVVSMDHNEMKLQHNGTEAHELVALNFLLDTEPHSTSTASISAEWSQSADLPSFALEDPSTSDTIEDKLENAILSLIRSGVRKEGATSALVMDELAAHPLPPQLERWLGRLRSAFGNAGEGKDDIEIARLLRMAHEALEAHKNHKPSTLFPHNDAQKVDGTLLEIGRECVDGKTRGSLEWRYLADTDTGSIFVEHAPFSSGPCPRVIELGLASVHAGYFSHNIVMHQYTIELSEIDRLLRACVSFAHTTIEAVENHINPQMVLGVETVFLFAPTRYSYEEVAFYDGTGAAIPLGKNAEASALLSNIHMQNDEPSAAPDPSGTSPKILWCLLRAKPSSVGTSFKLVSALVERTGSVELFRA